jgi:23S rRNA (cytidine1920-2'-O)/16S rRNA (cytidine1409-2'-O)-methyltransferase
LAPSRERAQADIAAGRVLVAGAVADKGSRQVAPGDAIVLRGPPPRFVSRGGEKLAGALDTFGVDPRGRRVLDAGASTGGFTDCVLQRGAAQVVAVDVGYGQLHERVAEDPRVRVVDRTNIRALSLDVLGEPVDLVVADLSFISLLLVVDPLLACCRPSADLVVLVKPQFEAGKEEASRGKGVITSPDVWRRVLREVIAAFVARQATIMGVMVSPLTGADGNVEFLLHAVAPARVTPPGARASRASVPDGPALDPTLDLLVDLAVRAATQRAEV